MEHQVTHKGIQLTTWEVNPAKRNINNIISMSVPEEIMLENKDKIITSGAKDPRSVYEIVEIIEVGPSALIGRNTVKAKSKWYIEPINLPNT